MSTKRELFIRASQVFEAGAMAALAKRDQDASLKSVLPLGTVTPAASSESQWRNLPPAQRVDLLETQKAPVSVDVRAEIATAVGEIICGQMKCKITPAEMASNLRFLPPQDFLDHLEETIGTTVPEDQRRRELAQRLEFIGNDGQVYVNIPLWESINVNLPQTVRTGLVGRNTAMVLGKSLDFHAFTHLVESKEEFNFSPFSFIAYGVRVLGVGKMIGLKFVGKAEDGSTVYLTGAHEASTELAAGIMANREAPPYTSLAYKEGAQLLAEINRAARISDNEFLKVKDGSLNTEWYLKKIASIQNPRNPDIKKAILAFAAIALAQAGATTWPEARSGAIGWLTPDAILTPQPTSVIRLPGR